MKLKGNAVIKYANQMNDLDLSEFRLIERRFLMALLYSCVDHEADKEITLTKQDFLDLGVYPSLDSRITLKRFKQDFDLVFEHCTQLRFLRIERYQHSFEKETIPLFKRSKYRFSEDLSEMEMHFYLNEEIVPYLNQVLKGFTKFPLLEYQGLKSTYSQDLYRLLKQYRSTGEFSISKSDFIKLLGIPKTYKECDISKRILEPSILELKNYFPDLRVEKVKEETGKSHKIHLYKFRWEKEIIEKWDPDKFKKYKRNTNSANSSDYYYPSLEEIRRFMKGRGLYISPEKAYAAINKAKSKGKPISNWKKYIEGISRNVFEKEIQGYPSWWYSLPDRSRSPKLLVEAIYEKWKNGKVSCTEAEIYLLKSHKRI